jgi:hypothetical protein
MKLKLQRACQGGLGNVCDAINCVINIGGFGGSGGFGHDIMRHL